MPFSVISWSTVVAGINCVYVGRIESCWLYLYKRSKEIEGIYQSELIEQKKKKSRVARTQMTNSVAENAFTAAASAANTRFKAIQASDSLPPIFLRLRTQKST